MLGLCRLSPSAFAIADPSTITSRTDFTKIGLIDGSLQVRRQLLTFLLHE